MSFVGDPRGRSGSCTFYGGFEYKHRNGPAATLTVGQFVYVRISPNDDPCIAELQLLWRDHQHSAQLASVQLYFLPEQTPDGRLPHQGQVDMSLFSSILLMHHVMQFRVNIASQPLTCLFYATDSRTCHPCAI